MFGFKKNMEDKFVLLEEKLPKFLIALNKLMYLLSSSENVAQADFVFQLIKLINQKQINQFIKLINGVNMWGGAGAVWEVHIEDKTIMEDYEKVMLEVIQLMEETKIIGKGIKPIKKIFEQNLKK